MAEVEVVMAVEEMVQQREKGSEICIGPFSLRRMKDRNLYSWEKRVFEGNRRNLSMRVLKIALKLYWVVSITLRLHDIQYNIQSF